MKTSRLSTLFIYVLAFSTLSCFSLREPALPSGSSGYITPTEPSVLLQNLNVAYTTLNADNFIRCFNEDKFKFTPEPTVPSAVSTFNNWALRKEERDVIINIRNKTTSSSLNRLTFTNPSENFITTDSLEYNAQYQLQLFNSDTAINSSNLQGRIRFIMVRNKNSNEWHINTWQDNRISTQFPCWTQLKQRFVAP
jgi:hypothetical protein